MATVRIDPFETWPDIPEQYGTAFDTIWAFDAAARKELYATDVQWQQAEDGKVMLLTVADTDLVANDA